jgi:hypothetical protein
MDNVAVNIRCVNRDAGVGLHLALRARAVPLPLHGGTISCGLFLFNCQSKEIGTLQRRFFSFLLALFY